MKKFKDSERPRGKCYDCLMPYGSFPDMVIPDDLWERINPTYDEGEGLLCPTCICKRLNDICAGDVACIVYAQRRVSYEQLLVDVADMGYVHTGEKYGMSETTVRNMIKMYEEEAADESN